MLKECSFPLHGPRCPGTARCGITRLLGSCCLLIMVVPTVGSRIVYNLFILHSLTLKKNRRVIFNSPIALALLVIVDFIIISVGNCTILSPVINEIVPALSCTEE